MTAPSFDSERDRPIGAVGKVGEHPGKPVGLAGGGEKTGEGTESIPEVAAEFPGNVRENAVGEYDISTIVMENCTFEDAAHELIVVEIDGGAIFENCSFVEHVASPSSDEDDTLSRPGESRQ